MTPQETEGDESSAIASTTVAFLATDPSTMRWNSLKVDSFPFCPSMITQPMLTTQSTSKVGKNNFIELVLGFLGFIESASDKLGRFPSEGSICPLQRRYLRPCISGTGLSKDLLTFV